MSGQRGVSSRARCAVMLSFAGAACGFGASARAQSYRYVEVPLLPGATFGEGLGVNDFGQAVGRCSFAAGTSQSWRFDAGAGVLTALPLGSHRGSEGAVAINDAGQIAGTVTNGSLSSAFVLTGGVVTTLTRDTTTLAESSVGTSINQSGQVAGRHSFQCGTSAPQRGAMWMTPSANPIEVVTAYPCGVGEARGINDLGWACGASQTQFTAPAEVWSRPAIWDGVAMRLLASINASGRESAFVNDLNNNGEACGRSEDRAAAPVVSLPVFWSNAGVIVVLGWVGGSECRSINDGRDVVGFMPSGATTSAVVWRGTPGGVAATPTDLNTVLVNPLTAPARLARADGISNTGFIVGRVDGASGSSRGFVLEPCVPGIIAATGGVREVGCGASVTLSCSAAGAGPLSYVWKRGGVDVGAGPELTIAAVGPEDQGAYSCVVTGACGSVTTPTATVVLACPADFDGSGGTPDTADIDAFFAAWLLGEPASDVDCSGGTPDGQDIDVFFTAWLQGGC